MRSPAHQFATLAIDVGGCGVTIGHGIVSGELDSRQGAASDWRMIPDRSGTGSPSRRPRVRIDDHHVRCYGLDDRGALGATSQPARYSPDSGSTRDRCRRG
jgi:hypothetical protein